MPKVNNSVLEINIYAMLSVIFMVVYFSFVTGKTYAENMPFIELVIMIKKQSSVFVIQKNDVAYLTGVKP